jgi:phosphatidylinositol alpha-1,6-mannosyltransferase
MKIAEKSDEEVSTDGSLDPRKYRREESKKNIKGNSFMRVLIYTHRFPPSKGGMETQSLNIARGLRRSGKEVVVLAPSYGSDEKKLDNSYNFKVIRIPLIGRKLIPLLKYFFGFLYLMVILFRFKPDIVLFIHKETHLIGGIIPFFPCKYIVRAIARPDFLCYSLKEFWLSPAIFIIRRMYSRAEKIICHSYSVMEILERAHLPMENIVVICSAVENRFFSEPPEDEVLIKLKHRFSIGIGEKVILTVARVVRRKGHDSVVKALPQILKEVPNLKYLIVGDGKYRRTVETMVEKLRVRDKVIFTGSIPHKDIIHFYDLCDIFVMPNRAVGGRIEGLPNSLLEAAARGKPIVAGANFGSREAVDDGKSGYLVQPDNLDEISTALLDLLKDEEKALAFGRNGKQKIQKQFSEDRMINEYLMVLENLNASSF